MKTDLLVVGGGLAGLATAAHATTLGLRVVVVEKLDHIGGSARLSAGVVWTAPDVDTFARISPAGDVERGRLLVDGFEAAIDALRDIDVSVSERWSGQMGFGVAYHVDIHDVISRYASIVEHGGNTILSASTIRRLTTADGRVTGAIVSMQHENIEIEASVTVIATGGFQGDKGTVQQFLGFGADDMLLRSNPGSVGDGLRLATEVGAGHSAALGHFYGHLIPAGISHWDESGFLPLTQYHSHASLVINSAGHRFTDETRGDEVTNQAALRQPEARVYLIADERIRREFATGAPYPHGQEVDRFAAADAAGGRILQASSINELLGQIAHWGVDAAEAKRTIEQYAAFARGERSAPGAPVSGTPSILAEPPFYAVECRPSLTFPFGGIAVDAHGRALDRDGAPIAGLYVVGADAGGLQGPGYVGGLALGIVFGPMTAQNVHAELSLAHPSA